MESMRHTRSGCYLALQPNPQQASHGPLLLARGKPPTLRLRLPIPTDGAGTGAVVAVTFKLRSQWHSLRPQAAAGTGPVTAGGHGVTGMGLSPHLGPLATQSTALDVLRSASR
jgi:hypothetical protein